MLVSSIKDLKELDRKFAEICEDLSYRPGTIFRIAHQYFANWGIQVTPENKPWIDGKSSASNHKEWERGRKATNEAIERAAIGAKISLGNKTLNEWVGNLVAEILVPMIRRKGEVTVSEVGLGTGDTTIAVLDALQRNEEEKEARGLVGKCHFYLLEPSWKRIAVARTAIDRHPLNDRGRLRRTIVESYDGAHFPMVMDQNFDMVYSNAVFHHMTFPDYLARIYSKLAADGVMVIGDWYTTIWKHPAFVVPILKGLGICEEKLQQFKSDFAIKEKDAEYYRRDLTTDQIRANEQMVDFEIELGREFGRIPADSRLFFLEAHEALSERLAKIETAGFVTDIDELRRDHEDFVNTRSSVRKIHGSEFASVIAAAKVPSNTGKRFVTLKQRV